MDSKTTMENFKTSDGKVGFVTISVSHDEIVSNINKAYKACLILGSPHSTQLANAIAEILEDQLVQYTVASEDVPGDVKELKRTIVNVIQMTSKTMEILKGVLKNDCEIMKLLQTIIQHFEKYEKEECELDSPDKDHVDCDHNKRAAVNSLSTMLPKYLKIGKPWDPDMYVDGYSSVEEQIKDQRRFEELMAANKPPGMDMLEFLFKYGTRAAKESNAYMAGESISQEPMDEESHSRYFHPTSEDEEP